MFPQEFNRGTFKGGDLAFLLGIFIFALSGELVEGARKWKTRVGLCGLGALNALRVVAPGLTKELESELVDLLRQLRGGRNGECHRTTAKGSRGLLTNRHVKKRQTQMTRVFTIINSSHLEASNPN